MPMAMKVRNVALALGCALLCAAPAFARKPPSHPPPAASATAHPVTLEQAVKQVQRQTHGHILATDTVTRGKTNVYRIKVLTPQGQVRVVQMRSNGRTQSDPGRSGSDKSSSEQNDSDQGGH
jgi:hypothetical protein